MNSREFKIRAGVARVKLERKFRRAKKPVITPVKEIKIQEFSPKKLFLTEIARAVGISRNTFYKYVRERK